jgi:hypothetical protein
VLAERRSAFFAAKNAIPRPFRAIQPDARDFTLARAIPRRTVGIRARRDDFKAIRPISRRSRKLQAKACAAHTFRGAPRRSGDSGFRFAAPAAPGAVWTRCLHDDGESARVDPDGARCPRSAVHRPP